MPGPTSARYSGSGRNGRCSSVTSTEWSSKSARLLSDSRTPRSRVERPPAELTDAVVEDPVVPDRGEGMHDPVHEPGHAATRAQVRNKSELAAAALIGERD